MCKIFFKSNKRLAQFFPHGLPLYDFIFCRFYCAGILFWKLPPPPTIPPPPSPKKNQLPSLRGACTSTKGGVRLRNSPVYTHSSSSLVQDQLHLEDSSRFSQVHYSAVQLEESHCIKHLNHLFYSGILILYSMNL